MKYHVPPPAIPTPSAPRTASSIVPRFTPEEPDRGGAVDAVETAIDVAVAEAVEVVVLEMVLLDEVEEAAVEDVVAELTVLDEVVAVEIVEDVVVDEGVLEELVAADEDVEVLDVEFTKEITETSLAP